jgi:amino acid adenylation domain-containing protein
MLNGTPVQRVSEAEATPIPIIDLSGLDTEAKKRTARRLMMEEAQRLFDLSAGPLLRVALLRQGEEEHVALHTMHHIISDGWSRSVLTREIGRLYSAYTKGMASPLEELPVQYGDYAHWQRQRMHELTLDRQLSYWKQALAGAPHVLELPTDRPRAGAHSYRGAYRGRMFPESLLQELRELSRREGTTLFMTLLAAFQTLLMRYSGQEDLLVGTAIAGRTRKEIEGLIGFFANTLVMRGQLGGNPSFRQLLGRVRETALGAYANQDLPFEYLVEELQPERSLDHTPLFQVMFMLQSAPKKQMDLSGLRFEPVERGNQTAKFDLTLNVIETRSGLSSGVEYRTGLFETATIDRLLGHYQTLLFGAVSGPETRLGELPLLSEAERKQLLVEWNATEADYPEDKCVHELFEAQVEKRPDAIALEREQECLTYGELNARSNRLAHHLRELGVKPGSFVTIILERSINLIVAELASLKCGAAYVPIDPGFPDKRQVYIASDCAAHIAITTKSVRAPEGLTARRVEIDDLGQAEGAVGNLNLPLESEMIAYVMYTSGSTGGPKGVMAPHRAIGRLVLNCGYAEFNADDRVVFAANPAFDASTMEVWAPLLNGGRIVIIDRDAFLNPESFAQALERSRVTALFLTTAIFNQYAQAIPEALARLRFLLCGGERSEPSSFARVLERSGPQRLIHCYGPTETTTFAITHEVNEVPEGAQNIPLGRPINNTQIYILDSNREPVPIGVTGEIYIGGAGVAAGYLNRPELTEEWFLPDPFRAEPGARLYKTGDLGRWLPNGVIEFLGRNDFQVKIRGFRIELGEIEANLNSHPQVREAVVIAHENVAGGKRLVAYYTGEEIGAEALRNYISSGLPEYMVPSAYVRLEALPLNANGKVDRRALPAPDVLAYGERVFEPPVGELETQLARIWAEVLRLDRVGRHDNYFELGGHSLLAVTLIERLRREGLQVDVRALFTTPTLSELAAAMEDLEIRL